MNENSTEPSKTDLHLRVEIFHPSLLDELITLHYYHQVNDDESVSASVTEDELTDSDYSIGKQDSVVVAETHDTTYDEEKRKKKVSQVFEEFLNYEDRLMESIRILSNIRDKAYSYENMKDNLIIREAFQNISSVYIIHSDMKRDLDSIKENGLSNLVPITLSKENRTVFLTLHKEFMRTFGHNYPRLAEVYSKDADFRALCVKNVLSSKFTEQHIQDVCGMYFGVNSCLPRYWMLLSRMEKLLLPDDPQKTDLQDILQSLNDSLVNTQDELVQREQKSKSKLFLPKIDGLRGVFQRIPPLLREGAVKKVPRRSTQKRILNRHMFLFPECLVITESENYSGHYLLKLVMNLSGIEVTEIDEHEDLGIPNCFRIRAKESCIEIAFSNENDRSEWWNAIQLAIAKASNDSATIAKSNVHRESVDDRAAEWVKDEQATMCAHCCARFTTVNRRHHCRACGRVFCGTCSAYRAPIAYAAGKVMRVCVVDYYIINRHLKPPSNEILNGMLQRNKTNYPPVHSGQLYWSTYSQSSWLTKPPFSTQKTRITYRQLPLADSDGSGATVGKREVGKPKVVLNYLSKAVVKLLHTGESGKANFQMPPQSSDLRDRESKDEEIREKVTASNTNLSDSHRPSLIDSCSSPSTVISVCTCKMFCAIRDSSLLSVYVAQADVKPWCELPLIGTRLVYLDKPRLNMCRSLSLDQLGGERNGGQRRSAPDSKPEVRYRVSNSCTRVHARNVESLNKEMTVLVNDNPSCRTENQPVHRQLDHSTQPPPLHKKPSRAFILSKLKSMSRQPIPSASVGEWQESNTRPEATKLVQHEWDPGVKLRSLDKTTDRTKVNSVLEDFRKRFQTSSTLKKKLQPLGPVEEIPSQLLNMLTNRQSFLILPLNAVFAHYFEAPTTEIRNRWINAIRETCINVLQK